MYSGFVANCFRDLTWTPAIIKRNKKSSPIIALAIWTTPRFPFYAVLLYMSMSALKLPWTWHFIVHSIIKWCTIKIEWQSNESLPDSIESSCDCCLSCRISVNTIQASALNRHTIVDADMRNSNTLFTEIIFFWLDIKFDQLTYHLLQTVFYKFQTAASSDTTVLLKLAASRRRSVSTISTSRHGSNLTGLSATAGGPKWARRCLYGQIIGL